ncbi:MAG TPA: hypothetical protein VKC61_15105 [Pyrinomonadaceae bacterium]|nr:hypothetical protein [Pyrinomonadaceae bacterium]
MNILASVVVGRSAVYVSAPITSGKRLARWVGSRNVEFDPSHPDNYADFQREVLEPNCEHAQNIIGDLRKRFPNVLIDPTALKDIDGWTQDDYRYLWAKVIEQYATTVVFIDGWQYSNGCSYEFLVSYQSASDHCPLVLDENLTPLTLEKGLILIRVASNELKEAGLSTEFLDRIAEQLAALALEEICIEP